MVSFLIIFVYCCKYDMQDFTFSRWQILPAEPLSIIARKFIRVEWPGEKVVRQTEILIYKFLSNDVE
jgi:hypothetical protein